MPQREIQCSGRTLQLEVNVPDEDGSAGRKPSRSHGAHLPPGHPSPPAALGKEGIDLSTIAAALCTRRAIAPNRRSDDRWLTTVHRLTSACEIQVNGIRMNGSATSPRSPPCSSVTPRSRLAAPRPPHARTHQATRIEILMGYGQDYPVEGDLTAGLRKRSTRTRQASSSPA